MPKQKEFTQWHTIQPLKSMVIQSIQLDGKMSMICWRKAGYKNVLYRNNYGNIERRNE